MRHKSGIRKGVTNLDTKVGHKVCRNAAIHKCHNAGIHKCHKAGYTSVTKCVTKRGYKGVHESQNGDTNAPAADRVTIVERISL